jgi:very-short-patch-repair endonuclease
VSGVEVLELLGGVATWSMLTRHCRPAEIRRLAATGDLVLDSRGHYALPQADESLRAASRLSAVLSHRSAAQFHGWAQKHPPAIPELTVAKNRKLTPSQLRGVAIHRAMLAPSDIDGPATSRQRTIADCLRSLPEDEALAIADSVLRSKAETSSSLRVLAATLRGPGSGQARRVSAAATGLSTNPFETELRRLATIAGLDVRPQVPLYAGRFLGRPDLVDVDRRIVLEADSFEWHGSRRALVRDARRYNRFVAAGWLVLRFTWEDVMCAPDDVLVVLDAVEPRGRTYCHCCRSECAKKGPVAPR